MKKAGLIIISLFVLTGCMTSKKMTALINEHTGQEYGFRGYERQEPGGWLTVQFDDGGPMENICKQEKYSFLPLILYWSWNTTIKCSFSTELRNKLFKNALYEMADSLNLKNKIPGNKLIIRVKEVPGTFTYTDKGHFIFFGIAYTISETNIIHTGVRTMEIAYTVYDDDIKTLQWEGILAYNELPLRNKNKNAKKFTADYVLYYKKHLRELAKDLVLKIIRDTPWAVE